LTLHEPANQYGSPFWLFLRTDDYSHIGVHDVELRVKLVDYPAVAPLSIYFKVTVEQCQIVDLFLDPDDIN